MRHIKRLISAVLILLGVVIAVPVFGGIASAHNSLIAGSAACDGTVSWTATSWGTNIPGGRANADIRVTEAIGTTITTLEDGAFTAANGFHFSGTFAWPANTASLTLTATPIAVWGDGVTSPTPGSATITRPANCPGQPGVSQSVACTNTAPGSGDGSVVLTLTNSAGQFGSDIAFSVYAPDQTVTFASYVVPTGTSKPVTFAGLADGAHTVKVLAGEVDKSQTFSIDCDVPVPAVTHDVLCVNGDGQVVITLSNTGGEAVVFDVTNPSTGIVEQVTVGANGSDTRTFSGFTDGDHVVVVKVGATDYSQSFTVACDQPNPVVTSTAVCDNNSHDGSVTISMANHGPRSATFQVTNPTSGTIDDVTIATAGIATRAFSGLTDGVHTVLVTADGQDLSQTFTVTCDVVASLTPVPASVTPVPASLSPVPATVSPVPVVELPRTGARQHLGTMLIFGMGLILVGGALTLSGRRRSSAR